MTHLTWSGCYRDLRVGSTGRLQTSRVDHKTHGCVRATTHGSPSITHGQNSPTSSVWSVESASFSTAIPAPRFECPLNLTPWHEKAYTILMQMSCEASLRRWNLIPSTVTRHSNSFKNMKREMKLFRQICSLSEASSATQQSAQSATRSKNLATLNLSSPSLMMTLKKQN